MDPCWRLKLYYFYSETHIKLKAWNVNKVCMLNGLLIDQWSIVGVVAEEEEEEVQLVIPNFAINCCSLTCSSSVVVVFHAFIGSHSQQSMANCRGSFPRFLPSFLAVWLRSMYSVDRRHWPQATEQPVILFWAPSVANLWSRSNTPPVL